MNYVPTRKMFKKIDTTSIFQFPTIFAQKCYYLPQNS